MDAQGIIERRRDLWERIGDIERDRAFVESVAEFITRPNDPASAVLRQAIQDHPEHLIEMVMVIVDKHKRTVPFFLNEVQQEFLADLNRAIADYRAGRRLSIRFLVLKGRQQGFTSFITAYQLACCLTRRNFAGFTLADEGDNTEAIFTDKAKFPYNQLPESLRPTELYNNRREFLFERLNSRWRIATASGKSIGRSKTLNFWHGSEAAFWDSIESVKASLGEALTKDSVQILESTANGHNEYKDLWDEDNGWEGKFYAWWRTPEYRLPFESTQAEERFRARVADSGGWVFERCRWLVEFIDLDWEQVYWYYHKWRDLKELVKQEYPCTADEAFLASGACVFDVEQIILRKEVLRRRYAEMPPLVGRMAFKWANPETKDRILDETIEFVEDPNGFIRVYEVPAGGYPYVLGGDTKGEGSDFFAATVINNTTGNRAATLHRDMEPDAYAHQVYCLGRWYNEALVGIESNFNTYPITELLRLGYRRQYLREKYDDYTGKTKPSYGFRTDGNSRPVIIDKERVALRDNPELFNDLNFLDECLSFVYDEKGRPDAASGKHDDILFSDMIANEIRRQQTTEIEVAPPPKVELPHALRTEEPREEGWLAW